MSQIRTSWEALERRHRTEEIWEQFGIPAAVDLEGRSVLVPALWAGWSLSGEVASQASLIAGAKAAGLTALAEGEGVVLSDVGTAVPEEWSGLLHGWLLGVYEENPGVFLTRQRRAINIPEDGALPRSSAWLERYYGGDNEFMPREKKPLVADLNRSQGAYLASVDEDPLVIMDTMSQIATLAGGFNPPQFQKAMDEGEMDAVILSSNWKSAPSLAERRRFESELQKHLPDALCHFAYANSGAEANEKAYILARLFGPGGKRILAFEGSFHGRTLLSLYSTWNKVKREPYQIKGYEVDFMPFPGSGRASTAPVTQEWLEFWTAPQGRTFPKSAAEPVLNREIECLETLQRALEKDDVCAVNLEPMQSEGGDNYGSARFFNGIRALTRAYGVPLIMDEVQTGFGLGGTFFWHNQFSFQKADGTPDHPDLIICAKKAQVGVTISVWPDPYPTPTQGASAIRGRIHAELAWRDHRSCEIHGMVEKALLELAEAMPVGLVSNGRCSGYALALDLPSAGIADAIVAQRFYRGAMVYKAGSHTLRYRLSHAFTNAEVGKLFSVLHESLQSIIDWAGGVGDGGDELFARMTAVKAPAWIPGTRSEKRAADSTPGEYTLRRCLAGEFEGLSSQVEAIEKRSYEPARQDDIETLRKVATGDDSIALVAESGGKVIGFSFAGALEGFREVQGPDTDREMDRQTTLYSADVTVDPDWRGKGVGGALKEAQVRYALGARTGSGSPRYAFITGRNRVGHTQVMGSINSRFGAYVLSTYTGQYGDPQGEAVYYRIPLRRLDRNVRVGEIVQGVNLADGVLEPLDPRNSEMRSGLARGAFNGAMMTKLTLSNFITPNVVRYVELMKEIRPEGTEHLYLTSCRDEMADKAIRTLRSYRKTGEVCISFTGAFFGHTTAGARSLSDWSGAAFEERMPWFDWPHVDHPGSGDLETESHGVEFFETLMAASSDLSEAGVERALAEAGLQGSVAEAQIRCEAKTLAQIQEIVERHGADCVIGVFAEAVQEKTGATLSLRMWRGLSALLTGFDVPLVMDETTTGMGRNGRSFWRENTLPIQPDVVLFYGGGQLGHVFVSDRYFLPKPLQLISTWDGDEVSMLRIAWLLRAVRTEAIQDHAMGFETSLRSILAAKGIHVSGEGAYLAFEAPKGEKSRLVSSLQSRGISVGEGQGNRILLVPSLTRAHHDDVKKAAETLGSLL